MVPVHLKVVVYEILELHPLMVSDRTALTKIRQTAVAANSHHLLCIVLDLFLSTWTSAPTAPLDATPFSKGKGWAGHRGGFQTLFCA